jgi:hypothetical protein
VAVHNSYRHQEERYVTSREACGRLCASPDSAWSFVNPWNNMLDSLAMFRAGVRVIGVTTLKPKVTTSECFGNYRECTK